MNPYYKVCNKSEINILLLHYYGAIIIVGKKWEYNKQYFAILLVYLR